MAVSDYSPLGLAKRFFTPHQDYGWNMQTTTSKPLINFNNSGFNPPMAGGQTIKPTAGVQGRNASPVSLAKPATVVAPAPVAAAKPAVGKSKSGGGSKGDKTLKAPISDASLPPLVPASTAAVVAPEVMGVGIDEPQLEAYGNVVPSLANPAMADLPALVPAAAAATVVAPEVTNAGNDASATLAGYNPVYASGGTSLYANPFSATMDAGYPQESIDGSALDYGTYKPGQSVLGRDTVFGDPTQYKNPEQVWNTSVNPEGQYTNLAGDGTVSLANPAASGYDFNMKDVASGVEALSGAANAYLGFKNYGLAKDMYGFQKGVANRNIANLATEHNADLRNRLDVGLSLAGNTKNPDMIAKADSTYASGSISGAPIK